MSILKKRVDFLNSEEGLEVKQALRRLVKDDAFNTEPSYSANVDLHPDHVISFVDKHMKYLSEHQSVNLSEYLSNLRLMTRIR